MGVLEAFEVVEIPASNEVYYTACSVFNNSRGKLHCQNGFNSILILCKTLTLALGGEVHCEDCTSTSLMSKSASLGPYRRTMPRTLWGSEGVDVFSRARYSAIARMNSRVARDDTQVCYPRTVSGYLQKESRLSVEGKRCVVSSFPFQ